MIVVLVIISISAVISVPRITTGIDTARFRHSISDVVSFLRNTHLDAILERKDIVVYIDYEDNTLKSNNDQFFNIPLDIVLNSVEFKDNQVAKYTFYSNGRGTGPRMEFLGNNEKKATVFVDLISGLAKFELN